MAAMRRLSALATVLVALVVLTPFACAIDAEIWTEGLYDAESDGLVQAARPSEGAVDCVTGFVPLADEVATATSAVSAPSPRAPPAV
jgi:hypothetical protein